MVGQNIYFKNKKVKVKIDSISKFFIKLNLLNNAKKIIKYNIENYKNDIIDGNFPLQFLEKDFLIKKRTIMQTTYENFGYILKSINKIIKFININTSHDKYYSRIEKLYISRFDNIRGKILPKNKGKIIGYPFEWLSLINIIEDSKNDYVKGWYNNKPFIEIKKNGLKN